MPPGGRFELLGFAIEGRQYDIADSSIDKIEWKLRHRAKKLVRIPHSGEYVLSQGKTGTVRW